MILIFKVILKFNVRLTLVLGYDSGTCWKKLFFFFAIHVQKQSCSYSVSTRNWKINSKALMHFNFLH